MEFASDDPKRITHALYGAFYTEPASWVQDWCVRFITSPHPAVRAEAILTLGHLAIREFRAIHSERAFTAARQLLDDRAAVVPPFAVQSYAQDALNDLRHARKLAQRRASRNSG
jgi:hypothetical protein